MATRVCVPAHTRKGKPVAGFCYDRKQRAQKTGKATFANVRNLDEISRPKIGDRSRANILAREIHTSSISRGNQVRKEFKGGKALADAELLINRLVRVRSTLRTNYERKEARLKKRNLLNRLTLSPIRK